MLKIVLLLETSVRYTVPLICAGRRAAIAEKSAGSPVDPGFRSGCKLAALDAHCEAIGRDPATVTRTAMVSLFVCANESDRDGLRQLVGYDNPEVSDRMIIAMGDEATEQLGALVTAGVDEIIVNLPLVKDVDAFHTAASVLRDATS